MDFDIDTVCNGDFQKVEIEYIPDQSDLEGNLHGNYKEVLERFISFGHGGHFGIYDEAAKDSKSGGGTDLKKGLSNRKRTAKDRKLHAYLRSCRNTVPVPGHWCEEEYIQGKRGSKKRPYELPDFIAATGIEKIRRAEKELDDAEPVMGMMHIDCRVLHDAFFKYQTKPKMTSYGEVYYEGKEFQVKPKKSKIGALPEKLETLTVSEGGACNPPPSNNPGDVSLQSQQQEEAGLKVINELPTIPGKSDGKKLSLTRELENLNNQTNRMSPSHQKVGESKTNGKDK